MKKFPHVFAAMLALACLFILTFPGLTKADQPRADQTPAEESVDWSYVVAKPTCKPRLIQGSDGKWNFVYELTATNFRPQPLTIKRITVSDDHGDVLFKLEGSKLKKVFTCIKAPHKRTRLESGETGVAWMNVVLDKKPAVASQLNHELAFKYGKKNLVQKFAVEIENIKPVVIGAPLKGDRWVAMGGYNGKLGHRRALMPIGNKLVLAQRYAIDWIKFDSKWRTWNGDWENEKNSVCYKEPILAVADGTIVGAVDKFKDQPPFEEAKDLNYPGGNCITLDIGNGLYAFYAHIKPGGLKVKAGQKVKKGQVIALVGNSGHSFEPHLHFHITDKPEILKGNGIPYVIESFKLEGTARDLDRYATNKPRVEPAPVKLEKTALELKNQIPQEGAIVAF